MIEAYKEYYNLFNTEDIGELGIEFFNAIGHLSDTKPKYVEQDPVVLIKEDLHSFVLLDDEKLDDLSCIKQISYVGKINNSIFERQVDDGFISYFAVDIDIPFDLCASYIKRIQRILMKCANRHTIVLYRVANYFILSYGYRNIGKNSNVVYSDWIVDDESADTIMDNAGVWYLSFRSLSRFAYDFQNAICRDKVSKALSYEAIVYDVFPQHFESFGIDEDKPPKREDKNEFVTWYRNQHWHIYDEMDDSFFLTKDNMLDDDYEIDVDELEIKMLEAEMRGEGISSADVDDFEEMDFSEFEQAIQIVDGGGNLSDVEEVLKQLEQREEQSAGDVLFSDDVESYPSLYDNEAMYDVNKSGLFFSDCLAGITVSGTIGEIVARTSPKIPFKLRRTTWKRPNLYFVVDEIRGSYAYGYILDDYVIERRASYSINDEKYLWNFQKDKE